MSHPPPYDSQQAMLAPSYGTMAMVPHQYHLPQHQPAHPPQHRGEVEYFYVYVAESEAANVGHWILLETDKTLSLKNLRVLYPTCFGIKYKVVKGSGNNEMEVRYIRYHNGFFRFPPGLDLNNTRFVAYYYSDEDDIKAFMQLAEANDSYQVRTGGIPEGGFATPQLPPDGGNDCTLMGRTMGVFEMDSILRSGAQSTPVKGGSISKMGAVMENVSSTSDCILNEPPVEVITIQDSTLRHTTLPPPPPGPPKPVTTPAHENPVQSPAPTPTGIKAKLGPSVSSTSDEKQFKPERSKHERITINDSSGFQRDRSSVMVKVNAAPKSKNMLGRYQQARPAPENVHSKTPLKVTFKSRGRQVQPNKKILKIEDSKGRTTALLTKRKWSAKPEIDYQKRRSEPEDEMDHQYQKRRRYDNQYQNHQPLDRKPTSSHAQEYRILNVLLVGFQDKAPIVEETTNYFSEFGTVTNFQLYTQENRLKVTEYYAYMEIRVGDSVSLFSDRHVYNGTIIYAIRVDGTRFPARPTCRVCNFYGLNVAYLAYHVEGQTHQQNLRKRLQSQADQHGRNVYLDSYYRITHDELYVQYPTNPVQEMVRNDYWKRSYQPATYTSDPASSGKRYYTDRERFY